MAMVIGLISAALTAVVFESATDRDWSLRGWEWPEVLAAYVLLVVAGLWFVSRVVPQPAHAVARSASVVANAALEQLGYRVGRMPPLASEPGFALELDFEYVLADYLRRRSDERPLFFVQIGAFDGVTHDRLHKHVHEGAWHGVLVEPQPQYFARLRRNYAGLDGLTFVNAAVDREPGSRQLYSYEDEHGKTIDSVASLASFSRERLVDGQRRMGRKAPTGMRIVGVPVACVTFEALLADTDHVDLLHIDAESYDLEVLRLFDFARFSPSIVRFEHVHLSRADWDTAVKILADHGYRVLREEHDTTAYRQPA
jgi:FkbM family methyltransferase